MIKVNVERFNPVDNNHYTETYEIEKTNKMKVLDALEQINEKYDAQIAYRYACRAGQCGSCAIKINGKAQLACKAEINDNDTLAPLSKENVMKDLVVNRAPYDAKQIERNIYLDLEGDYTERKNPEILKPESFSQIDELRSCIGCYSCLAVCPVINLTDNFDGPYFMRNIASFAFDPRDDDSKSDIAVEDGLYYCTSCGQCTQTCPKDIDIYAKAIEKLRELSFKEKVGPLKAHKGIRASVRDTGRSVKANGEGKYPEGFIKSYNQTHEFETKPKIAFFTGCMIDYKLPEIAESLIVILEKLGYEVDVPENQTCCGSPLLRTGQTDLIPELVEQNYETFKDYDIILTVCAGCGSTLKNNYPQYGVNLNVMDITEFLQGKIKKEDTNDLNLKVTYHDPCHLVRGQKISKQPREILKNLNGVTFIEMDKPDQCCGAGGGVKSGIPEIAQKLADEKVDMIEKLDVDHVVTICPFCEYNIQDSLDSSNSNVSVMNLIQLLRKAYE